MAKGKKTGGRNFKKGTSGNLLGPPKIPEDLKAARSLTRVELERILNKYLHMTKDEIMDAVQDDGTTALELMVASLVKNSIVFGDYKRVSFLLDRLGFIVAQKIEHTGGDGGAIKIEYTEAQKKKIAQAYLDDE